jgi:hypothetical protein
MNDKFSFCKGSALEQKKTNKKNNQFVHQPFCNSISSPLRLSRSLEEYIHGRPTSKLLNHWSSIGRKNERRKYQLNIKKQEGKERGERAHSKALLSTMEQVQLNGLWFFCGSIFYSFLFLFLVHV